MAKINQEEYEFLKGLGGGWKWIARDGFKGKLNVYNVRPTRSRFEKWWIKNKRCGFSKIVPIDLFQFVQWEDEEPYRISDLIKEYEKNQAYEIFNRQFESLYKIFNRQNESLYEESEETEVKKDLKEAILGIEVTQFDGQKADLEELVNPKQLEKVISDCMPEVLSQELPVIPKFVADYLEKAKKEINLLRVFEIANRRNELDVWRKEYAWIRLYHLDFARAWIDGYEIEPEPLYYIVDKNDEVLWSRDYEGVPRLSGSTLQSVLKSESKQRYQFTEQEIKDYDKRFWPFAEQVEQADFRLLF